MLVNGHAATPAGVEVFACEFGYKIVPGHRLFHLETDHAPVHVSFIFWVLKFHDEVILIDAGFPAHKAAEHDVRDYREPEQQLAKLGISAENVDTVIISHLHWDHLTDPKRFPRARFVVQREDVDYFMGRGRQHPVAKIADTSTLDAIVQLRAEGRLVELDGDAEIRSELRVELLGGHTPGSQITVLGSGAEQVVFACDASHFFENLERRTPSSILNSYDLYQRGFDRISALTRDGRWFPGHDPRMLELLDSEGDGIYRLPVAVAVTDSSSG